jgi:SAM-dependent methyltransferase
VIEESPSDIFRAYADIYDDLYSDKDYESECDFLEGLFQRFGHGNVQSILDLGCGTGGHAIPLARRGYKVLGIDRSARMLAIANQKAKEAMLSDEVKFDVANVQNVKLNKAFDVVISMFAVLSYQISNDELFSTISTARRHVKNGGLFISDFWYGPAVLHQRPEERIKHVRKDNEHIIRIVKPAINTRENVVDVSYDAIRLKGDRLVEEVQERHSMRFIFKPEIEFYLNQAGFCLECISAFADLEKDVNETTWNAVLAARAVA